MWFKSSTPSRTFTFGQIGSGALGRLLLLLLAAESSVTKAQQLCNPRNGNPPPDNGLPTCSLPVSDFASGRIVPGSQSRSTPFPPWMNLTLAREGQVYAQKNFFSATVYGALTGLILSVPTPDAASVLAFTGNTGNLTQAVSRYIATATQYQVWMEDLFCSDDPIDDDDAVLISIGNVNNHHRKAAARAEAVGLPYVPSNLYDGVTTDDRMWAAVAADLAASNLPNRTWDASYSQYDTGTRAINQYAQGLTLVAFMGYPAMSPTSTHILDATYEERRGFLHMWAILGWLLGIDDEYNICLQEDPDTAAEYIRELNEQYVYNAWFQIDKIGKVLSETVIKVFSPNLPVGYTMRVQMTILLRDSFGIEVDNMMSILSLPEQLILVSYDTVFAPTIPATRPVLNAGVDSVINDGVLLLFGPYLTYMDKAENVFYPNVTG